MKILVGSLLLYPDHSGIALYSSDFAFYAAEKGHDVKVVTGFPFYPSWKKRKDDKGILFRTDFHRNVKIYRGYLYVPAKPTGLKRILQEISFLQFAIVNFFRAGKSDVIVIFTTPVNLGVVAWFFKKLFSSKLVINIQDFQVEAAESLGMLGKLPIVPLMSSLERFSYNHSDLVTSISESMVKLVKEKGIPASKTYLWPNWIDVREASALGKGQTFRTQYGIPADKIIIGYAGNVGEKQGLKTLIDLAFIFKDQKDLIFLIIGQGGGLEALKNYHRTKSNDNLLFLPFLNPKGYKEFLADADVVFISQKKIPKDIYFPSKLLGLMAASKTIFVAADPGSELYKVMSKHRLGLVSEIGKMDEMTSCVERILKHDPEINTLKKNASDFARQFDREIVLNNILNELQALTQK